MPRKICFVVMPFSTKRTGLDVGKGPHEVNFDVLWSEALAPLIEDLGYVAVRADSDTGSLIINAMIERLAYADLVIADISLANANVYYEVGVRHTARRSGCVLIAADWADPVFDVQQMRRLVYPLPEGTVSPETAARVREALAPQIQSMVNKASPVHETVPAVSNALDQETPSLDRIKGQLYDPERVQKFRDEMEAIAALLAKMRAASNLPSTNEKEKKRKRDDALAIRDLVEANPTVMDAIRLEVMKLIRDCVGWSETVEYIDSMPESLRLRPEVQEQRLLALSHTATAEEAIAQLQLLVEKFGPSSERSGLIGGRYKRLYRAAKEAGHETAARRNLNQAIKHYYEGMMLDLNDYFPTCNLPVLLRARNRPGDLELAKFTAGVTLRACERARKLNAEDEWLRPTLLVAAFDAEDAIEAARLADEIELESTSEWKLATLLDDIHARVALVADPSKRTQLEEIAKRLSELLPREDKRGD